MELNHELIRSLLLFVESNDSLLGVSDDQLRDFVKKQNVSYEQLTYVIRRLEEKDLINAYIQTGSNIVVDMSINSLTFDGHAYLDNIRDPEVWKKTKSVTSKLASVSMDIAVKVASNVVIKMLGLD
ncbi:hypothetical protein C7M47_03104 [Lactiplantibacillus plantarum]|uniref:DUF2513 domain-containing protein n=1 Tax=Lactiplantibacillus plantarum TaxID=1590 RepID=UPI001362AFB4|nr:DUF2513 domain-containing protein [Lactiplantibacillus plantarum]QHM64139.1 hypothetical protein C7M47_03104 [Lactiplantibacillus plantarum]